MRFVFRRIADSWLLLGASMMVTGVSVLGTWKLCQPMISLLLETAPSADTRHIPDARYWGHTVQELNDFYDALGEDGCRLYVAVENWDLFPSMISYTLSLGAFLTLLARKFHGQDDRISLLASVAWILDIIETLIHRQGCMIYPDRLPDQIIILASGAVQVKCTVVIISFCLVIAGGVWVLWQAMMPSNKKQQ